jgi:hypothetical protein
MKLGSPFARDAIRSTVVMLVIPLSVLLILHRLIGPPLDWQDWARGVAMATFLYVVVMHQRYRRYSQ